MSSRTICRSVGPLALGLGVLLAAGHAEGSTPSAGKTVRELRALRSAERGKPVLARGSTSPHAMAMTLSGKGVVKTNVWMNGEEYGQALVLVRAPAASIRAAIQDYGAYRSFNPYRFKQSRVVRRDATSTDLYMTFSILKGQAELWTVSKFTLPHTEADGSVTIEGTFLQGNVKTSHVRWSIREVAQGLSIVRCDILIKPDLPGMSLFHSALLEELRDAADQAVEGVRRRAQGNSDNAKL